MKKYIYTFFLFLLFSFISSICYAQTTEINFSDINKKIKEIENTIKKGNSSKESIDSFSLYLNEQETYILKNNEYIEKQTSFIKKQLDALGEAPKEGISEDKSITKKRNELSKELSSKDKLIKEASLLLIKIEELNNQILNARSKKVYGNLVNKQSALINPKIFFNSTKSYVTFFWDVVKSPIEWYKNIPEKDRNYTLFNLLSMSLVLIIAMTFAIFLRKYIIDNWGYKKDIETPTFGKKVQAALSLAVARGLIPASFLGGCLIWSISTEIFKNSMLNTVSNITIFMTLLAILEATLTRVIFAPLYEKWRLINVSNEKADKFTKVLYMFIILNTITAIQLYIAKELLYSTETISFLITINCAIKAFFIAWLIKIPFTISNNNITNIEDVEQEEDSEVDNNFKIIFVSNIFCLFVFILSIFGYPELSLFIFNKTIITAIIIGLFELFRRFSIDLTEKIIFNGPWTKSIKIRKKTEKNIDFGLKVLINPLVILTLIFVLLNVWGLPGKFILQTSKKLLLGFKIGGIEISLLSIMISIFVFFISLTFVKIIKKHLSNNIFDKIEIDEGIKHSLISGVGFIGFIMSCLFAIIALGVDLTNLAFIAGALSVGIGFGLQEVIKNLVSGIIILFERPFKVGDWVIINDMEGKIKQINIRSTEMESFNRTSVIVPNATLLSNAVINLTHEDNTSRHNILVSVAYGTDVDKVKNILLECAKKHKHVSKNPAPYVIFKNFGDSALEFELRCYSNNIWDGWVIPSDLRYEINKRFIEEHIEIPFQQIVVHSGEKVSHEDQFYAKNK